MKPKSVVSISKKDTYTKSKVSIDSQFKLLEKNDCSKPLPTMNQEIAPPAYMWDRISAALDKQDNQKVKIKGNNPFSLFSKMGGNKLAMFAAVAMLAGALKTLFFKNPAF